MQKLSDPRVMLICMDENYLEAMGFLPDWQQTARLLKPSDMMSLSRRAWWDEIAVYSDPSGATACFFESADGESSDTLFTVHGPARVTVTGWQPSPGVAELSVVDDDGNEMTRVLAWVDDPHMYPIYPLKAVGEPARYRDYRMGAIAVDVEVFDDVEAWKKTQTPLDTSQSKAKDLIEGLPDEMYIGPQFVASPWLFALHAGEATAQQASPISMFKAVCREVKVVTNRLTGKKWYRIEADCAFPVTLALPIGVSPAPKAGSVVDGKAFLTGTTGFWLDDFQDPYA